MYTDAFTCTLFKIFTTAIHNKYEYVFQCYGRMIFVRDQHSKKMKLNNFFTGV